VNSFDEKMNVCDVQEKTAKHLALNDAISRIDDVNQHARDLLKKITNAEDEKIEHDLLEPKSMKPSLEEVLDSSPGRIMKACAEAHKTLEIISSKLF
jgi:hypothetical protein